MSERLLEVTEKLASVETATQQTFASILNPPKMEVKEDEEEEDQKVPGGLKNALEEISGKNLILTTQLAL